MFGFGPKRQLRQRCLASAPNGGYDGDVWLRPQTAVTTAMFGFGPKRQLRRREMTVRRQCLASAPNGSYDGKRRRYDDNVWLRPQTAVMTARGDGMTTMFGFGPKRQLRWHGDDGFGFGPKWQLRRNNGNNGGDGGDDDDITATLQQLQDDTHDDEGYRVCVRIHALRDHDGLLGANQVQTR